MVRGLKIGLPEGLKRGLPEGSLEGSKRGSKRALNVDPKDPIFRRLVPSHFFFREKF